MANLFDADNAPKEVPRAIVIGDLVQFKLTQFSTDYPNTSHSMTFMARSGTGANVEFSIAATNAFDGNLSNNCKVVGASNVQTSMVFDTNITNVTLVEVYQSDDSYSTQKVFANSGTQFNFLQNQWVTIYSGSPITLDKITVTSQNTSGEQPSLAGVKVNGKTLVDNGVTPQGVPSIAPTGCSVGTKQGFSIIKYNSGGSSGNYTLPHGMGKTPKFIIHKQLTSGNWWVYHADAVDDLKKYNKLNSTEGFETNSSNMWGDVFPNDSTFGINVGQLIGTSVDAITYLWADVPGLQKFGSYVGNGGSDGPFVELSFNPAIIFVKNIATGHNWGIIDSTRDPVNVAGHWLVPNANSVEFDFTGIYPIDILSNGFKARSGYNMFNTNGATYVYAAWAEVPSVNLFGGQSNAR